MHYGIDLLNKNAKLENDRYYNLGKLILKKDVIRHLEVPIGLDENGKKYYVNLNENNGIFIAGETGSGKSIFLDTLLISLLLKNSLENLQLLLIDFNKVEFNYYETLPHLIKPVITDVKVAIKSIEEILVRRKNELLENKDFSKKVPHIFIAIDEGLELLKENSAKQLLESVLLEGRKLKIHLLFSTSAYFKKYINISFLDLFSYVLTFDLASLEQAEFIQINKSHLLQTSGEAYIKYRSHINKIQTPYISTQEIKLVIDYLTKDN